MSTEAKDQVKELVTYLAHNLVGDRSQVRVETGKSHESILLSVAPGDRGAIIGKGGRTIKAMRTLLRTAAIRANTHAQLTLED